MRISQVTTLPTAFCWITQAPILILDEKDKVPLLYYVNDEIQTLYSNKDENYLESYTVHECDQNSLRHTTESMKTFSL